MIARFRTVMYPSVDEYRNAWDNCDYWIQYCMLKARTAETIEQYSDYHNRFVWWVNQKRRLIYAYFMSGGIRMEPCCRDCAKGPLFDPDNHMISEECRRYQLRYEIYVRRKTKPTAPMFWVTYATKWACPGYTPGPDHRFENSRLFSETMTRASTVVRRPSEEEK